MNWDNSYSMLRGKRVEFKVTVRKGHSSGSPPDALLLLRQHWLGRRAGGPASRGHGGGMQGFEKPQADGKDANRQIDGGDDFAGVEQSGLGAVDKYNEARRTEGVEKADVF